MKRIFTLGALACLFVLLLDAKEIVTTTREAVMLCLNSVIPSLLPFMVLSSYIRLGFSKVFIPYLKPIGTILRIPVGSELLWLIGILGGYPIGAVSINDAYVHSQIDKETGRRMLGFCCNCGPAFIFGVIGAMLDCPLTPWLIWGVHIASSIITAWLIPCRKANLQPTQALNINNRDILSGCVNSLSKVCIWVIMFRILISFLNKFILSKLAPAIYVLTCGLVELTNGCLLLDTVMPLGGKFILSSAMISFGGICVLLQTASVTKDIGIGLYFPGKVAQTIITVFLCAVIQCFFYPREEWIYIPAIVYIILFSLLAAIIVYFKKSCSIPKKNDV